MLESAKVDAVGVYFLHPILSSCTPNKQKYLWCLLFHLSPKTPPTALALVVLHLLLLADPPHNQLLPNGTCTTP